MLRRLTAFIAVTFLFTACGGGATGPGETGAPATLAIVSGDSQSDTVTRTLPDTLVAQLQDEDGNGISDAVISWVVTAGGGEVFSPSTGTNEDGFTRNRWTLGPTAGEQAVEARWVDPSTGEARVVGEFTADALPDSIVLIKVEADSATEASGDTATVGDTVQYTATAFDEHDNVNSESGFDWALSDSSVAEIDQGGELVATGGGSSAVLASKEGVTASDSVHVVSVPSVVIELPEDGAVFQSSWSDFALDFDGDDGAETPDADDLALGPQFTIEAWVKPRSLAPCTEPCGSSEIEHMISKWGSGSAASYNFGIRGDLLQLNTRANETNTLTTSSQSLTENEWQHVAAVFDNGEISLYIDGQLDVTNSSVNEPQPSTTPVSMGREDESLKHLDGVLDEIRIWSTVRSATDIEDNRSRTLSGDETGLVAYWPVDEGSGSVAPDSADGHDMQFAASPADPAWTSDTPLGEPIQFRGSGDDPDGGSVSLTWRSSIDGEIGTGEEFERADLSVGTHTIWLIGTDDEDMSDSTSVEITVE